MGWFNFEKTPVAKLMNSMGWEQHIARYGSWSLIPFSLIFIIVGGILLLFSRVAPASLDFIPGSYGLTGVILFAGIWVAIFLSGIIQYVEGYKLPALIKINLTLHPNIPVDSINVIAFSFNVIILYYAGVPVWITMGCMLLIGGMMWFLLMSGIPRNSPILLVCLLVNVASIATFTFPYVTPFSSGWILYTFWQSACFATVVLYRHRTTS